MHAATAEVAADRRAVPQRAAQAATRPSWNTVSRQILAEADALSAMDLMRMLDAQNRVSRRVGAFFDRHTNC